MEKDWHEIFVYDESSPTNLRGKHPRVGRGGSLVKRVNNGVAGGVNKAYQYDLTKELTQRHDLYNPHLAPTDSED